MAYDSPNCTAAAKASAFDGGCIEKSSPQVETQFKEMGSAIERLDNMLDRLGDRIVLVIREVGPTPCGVGAPEAELVPLANELRRNRQKVESLTDRVQSWINRIEL